MTDHAHMSAVSEAAERFFRENAPPQDRIGHADGSAAIWASLEAMMFPSAWMREDDGGAGLSARDSGQIVEAAGRYAFDAGLVDTIVARHWAGRTGLALPDGAAVTFAPLRLGDRVTLGASGRFSGTLRDVTGPPGLALVLAEGPDGPVLASVDLGHADVLSRRSGARGAVSTLRLDGLEATGLAAAPASDLAIRATAAAFAASWIAGGLRGLLGLCIGYANERVAFGRKIAGFQAIQHNLARLATETASAEVAARSALVAIDAGGGLLEGAAAKVRTDTAGREGCSIAHQLFGAIGFTIEHPLHLFTGQIGAMRDVHGAGPEWAVRIGRAAMARPGSELWPLMTDAPLFGTAMEALPHA